VIAVAPGQYLESLVVAKNLTLVGRCAEKVSLVGFGSNVRGLRVEGGATVTARGFTIAKQLFGVSVGLNSTLALTDSVLEGNQESGIILSEGASTFTGERLVVRDSVEGSQGDHGTGLNAQAGATVDVKDSSFSGNRYANVRLSSKSSGTFDHVVFRDGQPNSVQDVGRGISVQDGATAKITRSAFVDNYEIAIVAADGTTVDLEDVLAGGTRRSALGEFGRALDAFGGAQVHGKRFHAYDNRDASVIAVEKGTHVTLESSSIVETATDKGGYFGRAIGAQEGATVDVVDSAISGAHEVAVVALSDGTHVTLSRSIVTGTGPNAGGAFAHGIMAAQGAALDVEGSEISSNPGIGIAIGDASAHLTGVRLRENGVGLFVQDGTTLREADDDAPGPLEVTVTADTVFVGNATRVSSGVIPLPQASLAP
jgi:hypothetical protein